MFAFIFSCSSWFYFKLFGMILALQLHNMIINKGKSPKGKALKDKAYLDDSRTLAT